MTVAKCAAKAAHRAAQKRYVKANPTKHRAAVKRSEAKSSRKGSSSGEGKHGHKMGRPRSAC